MTDSPDSPLSPAVVFGHEFDLATLGRPADEMEPHTIDVMWGDDVTAIQPDEKYDGMPTPMKAADVKESFETMLRKLLPKRR